MRWQPIVIGMLSLITVVSLGANKLLIDSAVESYTEGLSVRLNPINTNRYAGTATTGSPVMMFGDSRIEMWPELQVAGQSINNRGISGETTVQMLGRLEAELTRMQPEVVVIQAGINDLKSIGVVPHLASEIESGTLERLKLIAATCRSRGAHPILFTVFPCGSVPFQRRFIWSDQIELARARVNSALLAMDKTEATIIDGDEILLGEPGTIKGPYAKDFLHLNAAGYSALQSVTTNAIVKALKEKQAAP